MILPASPAELAPHAATTSFVCHLAVLQPPVFRLLVTRHLMRTAWPILEPLLQRPTHKSFPDNTVAVPQTGCQVTTSGAGRSFISHFRDSADQNERQRRWQSVLSMVASLTRWLRSDSVLSQLSLRLSSVLSCCSVPFSLVLLHALCSVQDRPVTAVERRVQPRLSTYWNL